MITYFQDAFRYDLHTSRFRVILVMLERSRRCDVLLQQFVHFLFCTRHIVRVLSFNQILAAALVIEIHSLHWVGFCCFFRELLEFSIGSEFFIISR